MNKDIVHKYSSQNSVYFYATCGAAFDQKVKSDKEAFCFTNDWALVTCKKCLLRKSKK